MSNTVSKTQVISSSKGVTNSSSSNSTNKSKGSTGNDPLGTGQTDALKTYIDNKLEKIKEEADKGLKSGKITKAELSYIQKSIQKAFDNVGKALGDGGKINRTENSEIRDGFSDILDTIKSFNKNDSSDGL